MNTLVVLSALCAVAFGSAIVHETPEVAAARAAHLAAHAAAAHGRVGVLGVHGIVPAHVGYAGAWSHGAAPIDAHSGVVVDTPEVAHAKAEHLAAVAKARSGAHGVATWAGVPAISAWNAAPAISAWNAVPAVSAWNAAPAVWNVAHAAAHDDGQWHGEGIVDGAAYSGADGAINVYAAGHGLHGIVKEGQWSSALWGDKTDAANALGVGHLNGQWNAALWGDKSAHGHRWRRSAILAPAVVSPLAHSVAVAPAVVSPLARSVVSPLAHSVAISPLTTLHSTHAVSTLAAPAVTVGHLGLGHQTLLL